jgi:hypothetical protein
MSKIPTPPYVSVYCSQNVAWSSCFSFKLLCAIAFTLQSGADTCRTPETREKKYNIEVKWSATSHGGTWRDRRYSSHTFLTSALEEGEWSASRPGRVLRPKKEPPVPTVQETGWAPEPVCTHRLEEKSPTSARDRTNTITNIFILAVTINSTYYVRKSKNKN